ncbi:MAG: molybdopterin cofactor-binding domain-containing protein [Eubacteriales bacterium]
MNSLWRLLLPDGWRNTVKLDVSREETFISNRVRHAIRYHRHLRSSGWTVCRATDEARTPIRAATRATATASVPRARARLNRSTSTRNTTKVDAYTVFTNLPAAGAMRAYGIPQVSFAIESSVEDAAKVLGIDSTR